MSPLTGTLKIFGGVYDIIMASFMTQHLVYHWDLLIGLYLTPIKASRWAHLIVKCLELHFYMKM